MQMGVTDDRSENQFGSDALVPLVIDTHDTGSLWIGMPRPRPELRRPCVATHNLHIAMGSLLEYSLAP